MPIIDHLSYSSISQYLQCPRAWKFAYVDKIKTPAAAALVFGRAFHQVLGDYLRAGDGECDLIELWRSRWMKAVTAEDINWGNDNTASLRAVGERMLNSPEVLNHIKSIHPLVDSGHAHIERFAELEIPRVPVPIVGYIDIITADGIPGDFKTSSRRWSDNQAATELQPLFYLLLTSNALQDVCPPNLGLKFRHYVYTKGKTPSGTTYEHAHSQSELLWVEGLIRDVWKAIEAQHFYPNPTGWKCSSKYCNYWSMCRGANSEL